jgi:hypothetical protein
MGLIVENNAISMSDSAGNQRFTTAKRMPHLMYSASGSITIPDVAGSRYQGTGVDYSGNVVTGYYGFVVDRTDDYPVITNTAVQEAGAFVMPFFRISGSDLDTSGGSVTGSGSSILRLFVDGGGYFSGMMVLSPVVVGQTVYLRVKTTMDANDGGIANHPFINDTGATATLSASGLTIAYRVYYGRFE